MIEFLLFLVVSGDLVVEKTHIYIGTFQVEEKCELVGRNLAQRFEKFNGQHYCFPNRST